jgi:hypothetical protein
MVATVRGSDTQEECQWSHACSLQANSCIEQVWDPIASSSAKSCRKTRTVPAREGQAVRPSSEVDCVILDRTKLVAAQLPGGSHVRLFVPEERGGVGVSTTLCSYIAAVGEKGEGRESLQEGKAMWWRGGGGGGELTRAMSRR